MGSNKRNEGCGMERINKNIVWNIKILLSIVIT